MYHKVASRRLSWLVCSTHWLFQIAYEVDFGCLSTLAKRIQNQIVDWSTARDFTVAIFTTLYLYRARSISWSSPFLLYSGAPVNQERWPQRQPQFSCLSWLAKKPKQTNVSAKRNRPQFHNVLSWPFLFWVHQQKTFPMGAKVV